MNIENMKQRWMNTCDDLDLETKLKA